jgi:hypothetical protein
MEIFCLGFRIQGYFLLQFFYYKKMEKNMCILISFGSKKLKKIMSRIPVMILIYSQLSLKAMLVSNSRKIKRVKYWISCWQNQ